MTNENKGGFGRFLDWVNADQNLPTVEELEHHAHGHDEHAHPEDEHGHDDHGHKAHDAHTGHQKPAADAEHELQKPLHDDAHEDPSHEAVSARTETPEADEAPGESSGTHAEELDAQEALGQTAMEDAPAESFELSDEVDEELVYPDPVVSESEEDVQGDTVHAEHPTEQPVQRARPRSKKKQRAETARFAYGLFAGLLSVAIIAVLLATVNYLPEYGSPDNPAVNEVYTRYVEQGTEETGAVNIVGAMILDYRAFDTLGESLMLFTAAMTVVMLIRKPRTSAQSKGEEGDEA